MKMENEHEFESKEQELDSLGYELINMPCPNCGCNVMEKEKAVNTDPEDDGEILELDRVCPCCDWWDITYDA